MNIDLPSELPVKILPTTSIRLRTGNLFKMEEGNRTTTMHLYLSVELIVRDECLISMQQKISNECAKEYMVTYQHFAFQSSNIRE